VCDRRCDGSEKRRSSGCEMQSKPSTYLHPSLGKLAARSDTIRDGGTAAGLETESSGAQRYSLTHSSSNSVKRGQPIPA
jgi:hypothetical protein